ncbi:UNVERIFIED_CONTAM: Adenylate cyclase type 8 [Gekko kuhli]
MELSEVRCLSDSDELYTINQTPPSGGARSQRLLWQTAVRHITEQRFIQEHGKGLGSEEACCPNHSHHPRRQSAGKGLSGHNNGGTKVFPERASSSGDLGFLHLECAPSNSDFFLNWGYTYRGVIFPTLRNSFKSRDLERLYQRYFLGQRRKSEVVVNVLDVLTKLTLLLLHLTLALAPMDPIKGILLGFFTGIEVVICALVVVRKDTTSYTYLQYSGVVTWVAMATQILAAGLGCGLLGDGIGYVLFTLFVTYSMLPLPLTWAILAGLVTSLLQLVMQIVIPRLAVISINQLGLGHPVNLRAGQGCEPKESCFKSVTLFAPRQGTHQETPISQSQTLLATALLNGWVVTDRMGTVVGFCCIAIRNRVRSFLEVEGLREV